MAGWVGGWVDGDKHSLSIDWRGSGVCLRVVRFCMCLAAWQQGSRTNRAAACFVHPTPCALIIALHTQLTSHAVCAESYNAPHLHTKKHTKLSWSQWRESWTSQSPTARATTCCHQPHPSAQITALGVAWQQRQRRRQQRWQQQSRQLSPTTRL